jgi:hypothetical protein
MPPVVAAGICFASAVDIQDPVKPWNVSWMNELGMTVVALKVVWDELNPSPGYWDGTAMLALQSAVAAVHGQGRHVCISLMGFPLWLNGASDFPRDAAQGRVSVALQCWGPDLFKRDAFFELFYGTEEDPNTGRKKWQDVEPRNGWTFYRNFRWPTERYWYLRYVEELIDVLCTSLGLRDDDVIELFNEPNLMWWPIYTPNLEDPFVPTGTLIGPPHVADVAGSAHRAIKKHGTRPFLAIPGLNDTQRRGSRLLVSYVKFIEQLLPLLPEEEKRAFLWSCHSYDDLRLARQGVGPSAQGVCLNVTLMRAMLDGGGWRGTSAPPWATGRGKRPFVLITEGGDRLPDALGDLAVADVPEIDVVQSLAFRSYFDRLRGPDGEGVLAFCNYLFTASVDSKRGKAREEVTRLRKLTQVDELKYPDYKRPPEKPQLWKTFKAGFPR